MEPDDSPGGVDGGLPAGTWIKVVAETRQIGLGGWGVDSKPLGSVSVAGLDREAEYARDLRERQPRLAV